jgi:hypothetical protein
VAVTTPDARARSAGGKTRYIIAMPTGVIIPPAAPCTTRNATNSAKDPAVAHSTDAAVKAAVVPSRTRRPPNRSPAQPLAGTVTARLTR